MERPEPLLLLGPEHPQKGSVRIERLCGGVVAATTAGDGPSTYPKHDGNEDSVAVVPFPAGGAAIAVADSHFGAGAGVIAARGFRDALRSRSEAGDESLLDLVLDLDDAVRSGRADGDESETTLLVAAVIDGVLSFAAVGDSPLFLFRNGTGISRLAGFSRTFLGGRNRLRPIRARPRITGSVLELGTMRLLPGDLILAASDGIETEFSGLDAEDLAALLAREALLETRVTDLMRAGGRAPGGGRDNLSVVAVEP